MSAFWDIFAFLATFGLFAGVIAGAMFVSRSINAAMDKTKNDLKSKGVAITDSGLAIKTSSRFSREDYVDATQRAFISGSKAMALAGSFGHADDINNPGHKPLPGSPRAAGSPSTSPKSSPVQSRSNSLMGAVGGWNGTGSAETSPVAAPGAPRRRDSEISGKSGASDKDKKRGGLFGAMKRRDSTK